jgi:hypothetical protein
MLELHAARTKLGQSRLNVVDIEGHLGGFARGLSGRCEDHELATGTLEAQAAGAFFGRR